MEAILTNGQPDIQAGKAGQNQDAKPRRTQATLL
jgi:hypothetical protein